MQKELLEQTIDQSVDNTQFGYHLIIDGYRGSRETLANPSHLKLVLEKIAEMIGMDGAPEPIVSEMSAVSDNSPACMSGFVMKADRHVSIRNFPIQGYICADIYSCPNPSNAVSVVSELQVMFELGRVDSKIVQRLENRGSDFFG